MLRLLVRESVVTFRGFIFAFSEFPFPVIRLALSRKGCFVTYLLIFGHSSYLDSQPLIIIFSFCLNCQETTGRILCSVVRGLSRNSPATRASGFHRTWPGAFRTDSGSCSQAPHVSCAALPSLPNDQAQLSWLPETVPEIAIRSFRSVHSNHMLKC